MTTLIRLSKFLKPSINMVILSVLIGSATIASGIGLMGTSAFLIASAALHPSLGSLQVAIVGVRFFGLSRAVIRYLERIISHSLNFKILANIRLWFFQEIEPYAPANLVKRKSGDLLNLSVADIDELENFYIRVVSPPLTAIIITIGASAFAGRFDANLGWFFLFAFTLNAIAIPAFGLYISRTAGRELISARVKLSGEALDFFQGIEDIQVFNLQGEISEKLTEINREYTGARLKLSFAGGLADSFSIFINSYTVLVFLFLAAPMVIESQLSGIMLTVLTLILIASFETFTPLQAAAQYYEACIQSARRLFKTTQKPEDVIIPGKENLSTDEKFDVRVNKLSFHYPDEEQDVLQQINLQIQTGQSVAIVGASGSGKTTLINLLQRFWEYSQGQILVNGVDLKEIDVHNLRERISVCNQNNYVFNGSIRDNLELAGENIDPEQMMLGLEVVELKDWALSLPQTLDTWVGEHGIQMSGGERQRLCIARSILRPVPFYIFDEPFSNLDINSEMRIIKHLQELLDKKTSLWITHRLYQMGRYSMIYVMRDGKIIETGRHEDLIRRKGTYAQMVELQKMNISDM